MYMEYAILFLGQLIFEKISLFCESFGDLIPVTFVLGFYVSLLVTRWWKQFESIPWPDSAAVWISTCIKGHDERGRLMRRTIVRYINLCLILTFRLVSLPVKKRFPTLQHLEDAGILVGRERQVSLDLRYPKEDLLSTLKKGTLEPRMHSGLTSGHDFCLLL
jgi:hypothetical protein